MNKLEGPVLPGGETYDVKGLKAALQKIAAKPALGEVVKRGAEARAEDVYESGELDKRIHEADLVLYSGAGTGHVPKYIEEHTKAKIFKLDLADLRTPDTKDKKFLIANARQLPIADESLNVVCLFDILHHTKNQEELLKEAFRVLKPGGKCLIMEDTIPEEINYGAGLGKVRAKAKKWLVGKMDDTFNLQSKGVNPHNYHPISDWELMGHDAGFEVNAKTTKSWHWGVEDFLGASRKTRPSEPTWRRLMQATMFEFVKK